MDQPPKPEKVHKSKKVYDARDLGKKAALEKSLKHVMKRSQGMEMKTVTIKTKPNIQRTYDWAKSIINQADFGSQFQVYSNPLDHEITFERPRDRPNKSNHRRINNLREHRVIKFREGKQYEEKKAKKRRDDNPLSAIRNNRLQHQNA